MVVDEAKQVRPALLARLTGVRQPGADQRIALPERVDLFALEAPVGRRPLGQQAPGLTAAAQVRRERVHVDRVLQVQAGVALQDVHQGLRGPGGLFLAQGNGLRQHGRRQRARHAGIAPPAAAPRSRLYDTP